MVGYWKMKTQKLSSMSENNQRANFKGENNFDFNLQQFQAIQSINYHDCH